MVLLQSGIFLFLPVYDPNVALQVALQFPDALLGDSAEVCRLIEQEVAFDKLLIEPTIFLNSSLFLLVQYENGRKGCSNLELSNYFYVFVYNTFVS